MIKSEEVDLKPLGRFHREQCGDVRMRSVGQSVAGEWTGPSSVNNTQVATDPNS